MSRFLARETNGGFWSGPVRTPRNTAAHQVGTLHDDATAQKFGFRGGIIAGSLHMDQFPPLLARLLGDRWWQTGGLSLYFRFATTHLEPVQCFAVPPRPANGSAPRIEVWMNHQNGERVAEGSASTGGLDTGSALRQRIAVVPPSGELRILANVLPAASCTDVPARIADTAVCERLGVITEPCVEYTTSSPWQRAALPPSLAVRALRAVESNLLGGSGAAAGLMFGAVELQHLQGPLFAEEDFVVRGRVLAVSDTPKTEYLWYESTLSDGSGADRACMLMMLRYMKAASPMWA